MEIMHLFKQKKKSVTKQESALTQHIIYCLHPSGLVNRYMFIIVTQGVNRRFSPLSSHIFSDKAHKPDRITMRSGRMSLFRSSLRNHLYTASHPLITRVCGSWLSSTQTSSVRSGLTKLLCCCPSSGRRGVEVFCKCDRVQIVPLVTDCKQCMSKLHLPTTISISTLCSKQKLEWILLGLHGTDQSTVVQTVNGRPKKKEAWFSATLLLNLKSAAYICVQFVVCNFLVADSKTHSHSMIVPP